MWGTGNVKINFELRPNAQWARPGEIRKFRPVQISNRDEKN
jgi:hypothetical protein